MNIKKWLKANTESLMGKRVAVTGSTGGIGEHLSMYLACLGASLLLLDRNPQKADSLKTKILSKYPQTDITLIHLNLEEEESVFSACEKLEKANIDVFIHNAGAYSIPRKTCKSGFDNVFQINFLSPYYMINRLLPALRQRNGRVVVVGSIAHNYSKSNPENVDFASVPAASRVYGNAKRYLMFALYELFENEKEASLSVTHPGITFTNITAHYPKLIFALIKHPMKIIFMSRKKAALSVLRGVFLECKTNEWIGPRVFSVWGLPRKQTLNTCSEQEREEIFKSASAALEVYKNENR